MATIDDYAQINRGLALYRDGEAWEAHEAWETPWRAAEGHEQSVLQVLIQVAAAVHKHQQDVPAGVRKNLEKAVGNLETVRHLDACLGIDLVALDAQLRAALAAETFCPPELPTSTGRDGFIYLHGFASSPRSAKARVIVPPLRARGWSVTVPDLNEDDFTNLTISRSVRRIRRLLRDRTILIGSSLGGYLSALVQSDDERVIATVQMAPAYDFVERLRDKYGDEALEKWANRGTAEVEHYGYGRPAQIGYTLVVDAEQYPSRPPFRVSTYVLQGRQDDVVPAAMVAEVVASAPDGLVEYDEVDDDHALGRSAERARSAAEAMAERYDFVADPR